MGLKIDLTKFERAAYSRAPDCAQITIDALRNFLIGDLVENADWPNAWIAPEALAGRICAALTAVMADPAVRFSADQVDRLAVFAPDIARLFQATRLETPDFILRALSPPAGVSAQVLKGRLSLLSLESTVDWPAEFLAMLTPRDAQQTLAQLIANKPVMSERGQTRRDRLLEFAPSLATADLPNTIDHLVLISAAWMNCSYAATPRKHDIKRPFNHMLRDMAHAWGFNDVALPEVRTRKQRPVLLFASEIMISKHVQYRYFGQYLRQLRSRFELVLLTEVKEVDDAVRALFDRVLTFDRTHNSQLHDIYQTIVETAPDILFYPSVGMRRWGPLFANLRLAPIQLTALGHSASTFCDTIDYFLLEEGYVSDPVLFGETVITVPDESLIFERVPDFAPPAPNIRVKPDTLRIVLPSNVLKLNPNFLATVAAIRAATDRPLEFHLLPNARGLELAAVTIAADRQLPGAIVHPTLPSELYIEIVSAGDLSLSPFPFGGLHSVVDSLRQGLPVVAMECPEPHGRTDAMLLRRLGMPEWLITRTEEEYVAAALRIIEDDDLRVQLSQQALALDVGTVMFGDATTPLRREIVDSMWWLYENHETAQADGRKCWSLADRKAFGRS